jgi:hypothetical protein
VSKGILEPSVIIKQGPIKGTEREVSMKKKHLKKALRQAEDALEHTQTTLGYTQTELQAWRTALENQMQSDRITQGWITSDDLGSGFAELTRELGFTPPYVFGREHDKETGEIIILTGLKEKDDGLLYVVRTEVN